MMIARFGPSVLLIAGGILAVILFASRDRIWPSPEVQNDLQAPTRWQRWHAFGQTERAAHATEFQGISRRDDARRVLDNAAAFAALPASQQERLRELNFMCEKVIREQATDRQRWLNSIPGQARALELYRLIKRDHPERLRRF